MNGIPSQSPGSKPSESPKRDFLRQVIETQRRYTTGTDELKRSLQKDINLHVETIRYENLIYSEDPYKSGAFFNLQNVDKAIIQTAGGELTFLRKLINYLNNNDTDKDQSILNIDQWLNHEFSIDDFIQTFNSDAQSQSWYEPSIEKFSGTESTGDKPVVDNYWDSWNSLNFDFDDVYTNTIEKDTNQFRPGPDGLFIGLGDPRASEYLRFMVYSLQSTEDIQSTILYIAPDSTQYLIKFNDKRKPIQEWAIHRDSISWSDIDEDAQKNYEKYITRGTQQEKAAEIGQYLNKHQLEVQEVQKENLLTQPEAELVQGEERLISESSTESLDEQTESTSTQNFTPAQIQERIRILNEMIEKNPSKLLNILNWFGIKQELVIGALAMDKSVPTHELKISITRVISAGFTALFFKKSLPSFITGEKNSNADSGLAVEPPNSHEATSQTKLTPTNYPQLQNDLHRQLRSEYIVEDDIKLKPTDAIYLAPNTEINMAKNENIKLFSDIDAKNELTEANLNTEENDEGKTITIKKEK